MGKEQKTRTEKLEKHAPETQPMIICEVKSVPRMRSQRSKVKAASKTKTTTARVKTKVEKSGNSMKLCVNLMPVLASAKEEEEDDDEEEEIRKEEETCHRRQTCERTLDPGLDRTTETSRTLSPWCVLPPITKPVEVEEHLRSRRRRRSPLPDIGLTERTVAMTTKTSSGRKRDQASGAREELDHRAWTDKPLSNTRSDEFCLPDISLSSLETLLQTVTEKLGRRKRSDEEEPWRHFRSDGLLVVHHLKEKRRMEHCPEGRNPARVVDRHKSLPPLIFAMTKKNPTI